MKRLKRRHTNCFVLFKLFSKFLFSLVAIDHKIKHYSYQNLYSPENVSLRNQIAQQAPTDNRRWIQRGHLPAVPQCVLLPSEFSLTLSFYRSRFQLEFL